MKKHTKIEYAMLFFFGLAIAITISCAFHDNVYIIVAGIVCYAIFLLLKQISELRRNEIPHNPFPEKDNQRFIHNYNKN